MQDDKDRCELLAKSLPEGVTVRDALGAWESFVYRVSRQVGYLLTEPERNVLWVSFASSFILLVTTGKKTPHDAVDTFFDLSADFAKGQKP